MIYEIISKSDVTSGAALTVRILEIDLDKKALYTIGADIPPFLVPFHHRNIDGSVELTYPLGTYGKLQYFFGSRSPGEYVTLWQSILTPLLDCDDWFMDPLSLVLDTEHLYYDKHEQAVRYIYIPSVKPSSDYEGMKDMISSLVRQIPVTDPGLENKMLRAAMQDFNPRHFLQALKEHQPLAAAPAAVPIPAAAPPQPPVAPPPRPVQEPPKAQEQKAPVPVPPPHVQTPALLPASDDIVINLAAGKKQKPQKVEKPPKAPKPSQGKIKPGGPNQILGGAVVESAQGHGGFQAPVSPPPPPQPVLPEIDEVTILDDSLYANGPKLRLVGDPALPRTIVVDIHIGQPFTIGRYDTSMGRQQSSFEFGKATRAVSRQHAVIERNSDGYILVDLSSRAGTFLNGQRLVPNMVYRLDPGSQVSFGNAGANYIWE